MPLTVLGIILLIHRICGCPDLLPVSWQGGCYGLLEGSLTHTEAESFCLSQHAHLVWISNREEQEFIRHHFMNNSESNELIWIGCKQNTFVWTHNNQGLFYSNWSPRETDVTMGDACCVMDSSQDGRWSQMSCNSQEVTKFICKQEELTEMTSWRVLCSTPTLPAGGVVIVLNNTELIACSVGIGIGVVLMVILCMCCRWKCCTCSPCCKRNTNRPNYDRLNAENT